MLKRLLLLAALGGAPSTMISAGPHDNAAILEVSAPIRAEADDAEECEELEICDGRVTIHSSDLDLGDYETELVGLRFRLDVPKDATIVSAWIQFTAEQDDDDRSTITIRVEDAYNAEPFADVARNISSRSLVSTHVEWDVGPWFGNHDAGPLQRTPNLASLVQPIVRGPKWASAQHIVFVLQGSGERDAYTVEESRLEAPVLTVRYLTTEPSSAALSAGAAMSDITPPPGLPSFGYSTAGQTSVGVRTRLHARALYLESGGEGAVLVQCDLGAVSAILWHRVVAAVQSQIPSLRARNVLISATHTHAGPGGYSELAYYNNLASSSWFSGFDPALLRFLTDRIRDAILDAYYLRGKAAVAHGAVNHYGSTRNRSPEAYDRNSGLDGTLPPFNPVFSMLRVDRVLSSGDKRPLAAYTNFAVHGTALPATNDLYSGDIHAHYGRRLEWLVDARGFIHLTSNANEGDVSPNYHPEDRTTEPYDEADDLGRRLAQHAFVLFEQLDGELEDDGITIRTGVRKLGLDSLCSGDDKLKPREMPMVGASLLAGTEDGRPDFPIAREGERLSRADGCQGYKKSALKVLQTHIVERDHLPMWLTIQAFRLGELLVVTFPGESTTHLGRRILTRLADAYAEQGISRVILVGLANQFSSYFTTPEEYDEQHYEGGSNLFGPKTGPFLLDSLASLSAEVVGGTNVDDFNGAAFVHQDPKDVYPPAAPFDDVREELQAPHVTKRPKRLGYAVSFEWNDRRPGSIGLDRPLVRVEQYVGEKWITAVDGEGIPQDDRGVSIEIRVTCGNPRTCGRWRATWYPKELEDGKRYRFVVLPRGLADHMEPAYSPALRSSEFVRPQE